MSTEKWVAGATAGWATAFNGSDVNSLANGSGVMSSVSDIANGTNLDMFAFLSIQLGSVTAAAPNYIGFFLYPLNSDGSTYGDNKFASGSQVSAAPSPHYWRGNITFPTGTATIKGSTIEPIRIPPGSFRFVFYNQAGVSLASSGNVVQYYTANRSVT